MFCNSKGRNCMLYLAIILPCSRTKISYSVLVLYKIMSQTTSETEQKLNKKKTEFTCLLLINNEVYYFEFEILPEVLRE